jgi:hypothetical protein
VLTKLGELKKRYYLSKYLSNIKITEEFAADEEILDLITRFRELQADFSSYHSMVEEKRQAVPVINSITYSKSKSLRRILRNCSLINYTSQLQSQNSKKNILIKKNSRNY